MAAKRHDIDKRLVSKALLEQRLQPVKIGRVLQLRVKRRLNTADHWNQVGNESDAHITSGRPGQTLANLWQMTMP
jgi:hypothetical protein